MTDSRDDLIAKLTADNAALVALIREREQRHDDKEPPCYCPPGYTNDEDRCADSNACARISAVLRGEHGGAGWVSPEEHARVVQDVSTRRRADYDASLKQLAAERDAARARLAEVEAELSRALAAAKAWEETALLHCRNETYWRDRAERAEVELARVKAEAEGLRALLAKIESTKTYNMAEVKAALASPTPAQGDEVSAGQKTTVWTSR